MSQEKDLEKEGVKKQEGNQERRNSNVQRRDISEEGIVRVLSFAERSKQFEKYPLCLATGWSL